MADPFSSLLGISRQLTTRNSSALLTVGVLVFGGACLGLSDAASGSVRLAALAIGSGAALLGLASAANLLFLRPGRLDSHELKQMSAYLEWLSRPELDERAIRSAEIVLPTIFQQKSLKDPRQAPGAEADDD